MIQRYDQRLMIIGIRADERDEVVIIMIPHKEHEMFRILVIGAGMGRFTMKLSERFPNAEIVCLDSARAVLNTKYYDDIWAHYIQVKTREVLGIQREIEDVKKRMYEALKKEGDKPAIVEDQVHWILEAGFTVAECVWKYYLLAVIIGIKSV